MQYDEFENYAFKITATSSRGQWGKSFLIEDMDPSVLLYY